MAIFLQVPNTARARPTTKLKREYSDIFFDEADRDLYVVCALLDRQVDDYLAGRDDMTPSEVTDVKYYVEMLVAGRMLSPSAVSKKTVPTLLEKVAKGVQKGLLRTCSEQVLKDYRSLGGESTVAKGSELRTKLLKRLEAYNAKQTASG